ncbi:DUF6099 family protein [Streptacidiphilus monticola]
MLTAAVAQAAAQRFSAQALVGAGCGPAEIARALVDAGLHMAELVQRPPDEPEEEPFGRSSRLTELGEPGPVLRELRTLVNESAEALIVLACGADEQSLYWRCIDSVDAAAECRDLLTELLRATGEEADPERARETEEDYRAAVVATASVTLDPPPG